MVSLPDGLHGAYQRSELTRLIGRDTVRAAVVDGRLARFGRRVLVDSRKATSLYSRAAATQLFAGPDSALTGFTALAVRGCSAAPTGPVHVLVPYHRKPEPQPGVMVHHGCFEEQDVQDVVGLRTMAADFALAEVLCRARRRDALACADQMLALMPESARAEFRASVEERIRTRPDPRGRRRGRVLLDLATGLAESPPESWTLLLIFDAGLPIPDAQFRIYDLSGKEIYRLDLAWPELRIAVEYDGYETHEDRAAADAARDADLRRRGWIVIRAKSDDLRDSSRLIAAIHTAFRARGMAA